MIRLLAPLAASSILMVASIAAAQQPAPPPGQPAPPAGQPAPGQPPPGQPPPGQPPFQPQPQPPPGQFQPQPQPPPPAAPPPGYGQPAQGIPPGGGYAQPYNAPPPGSGYGAPYGNSGYSQGYGYGGPPEGPPPPPPREKREPGCCRFALRYDPFDLIFGRATWQAEVGVIGPLAIDVEPSWIWGNNLAQDLDETGFAIAANVGLYVSGRYLKGFFVKGQVGFESFDATLTHPQTGTQVSSNVSSPVFGLLIGSSNIWGNDDVGFNLSGGIGIGVAPGEKVVLTAAGDPTQDVPDLQVTYYDKAGIIRLLGSLGLGVAF
jgi:hypothetical protein